MLFRTVFLYLKKTVKHSLEGYKPPRSGGSQLCSDTNIRLSHGVFEIGLCPRGRVFQS
jgi:hypothetical protein